jgi:hypothetical protein
MDRNKWFVFADPPRIHPGICLLSIQSVIIRFKARSPTLLTILESQSRFNKNMRLSRGPRCQREGIPRKGASCVGIWKRLHYPNRTRKRGFVVGVAGLAFSGLLTSTGAVQFCLDATVPSCFELGLLKCLAFSSKLGAHARTSNLYG